MYLKYYDIIITLDNILKTHQAVPVHVFFPPFFEGNVAPASKSTAFAPCRANSLLTPVASHAPPEPVTVRNAPYFGW